MSQRIDSVGVSAANCPPSLPFFFLGPSTKPHPDIHQMPTNQVTGIDLVQSQIRLAEGRSLGEVGLVQKDISTRGFAIQCRITTEDPLNGFAPDTGGALENETVEKAKGLAFFFLRSFTSSAGSILQAASMSGDRLAALASVKMAAPCTLAPRCCPTTTPC